jgi:hypothetical protein
VLPGGDALVPDRLRSETEAKAEGRLADAVGQGWGHRQLSLDAGSDRSF